MNFFTKILLGVVLVSTMFSVAVADVISVKDNYYELTHKLSREQLRNLALVYNTAKIDNLQNTATAIAWQESKFGKNKINLADPSCGYFHQLLPDLAERLNIRGNNWNMSRLCENLQQFEYSYITFKATFQEKIQMCKRFYGENASPGRIWKCAVTHYNGSGKRAREYYINIRNKIKALAKYIKSHKIDTQKILE